MSPERRKGEEGEGGGKRGKFLGKEGEGKEWEKEGKPLNHNQLQ